MTTVLGASDIVSPYLYVLLQPHWVTDASNLLEMQQLMNMNRCSTKGATIIYKLSENSIGHEWPYNIFNMGGIII